MTQSFTMIASDKSANSGGASRRTVLITGAAGNSGSYVAEHTHDRYELKLMVQQPDDADAIRAFGEVVVGDSGDLEALKQLCHGLIPCCILPPIPIRAPHG